MRKILMSVIAAGLGSHVYSQTAAPYTELFCPIDTSWTGKTIVVPSGSLKYNILMRESDIAVNLEKGTNAPLKGGFGAVHYDEIKSAASSTVGSMVITATEEGWLYMSLLDNKKGTTGDGGGIVKLRVKENTATHEWEVVPQTGSSGTYNYRFIDLDGLGGTVSNNGLHLGFNNRSDVTNHGNLFMFDGWAGSNADISGGVTDISNYILPAGSPEAGRSIPRYQNMGWITEISRVTGKPVRKLYLAGRGDFGGMKVSSVLASSSSETSLEGYLKIYFTTQTQPAVLLQYDGSKQAIYAYKQEAGTDIGNWLLLNDIDVDGSLFPFTFDELSDVQQLALKKGATMFNRLGSILAGEKPGQLYIAETGGNSEGDQFSNPAKIYNGKLASHLQGLDPDNDGKFTDPYGRILLLEPNTAGKITCKTFLAGGTTKDGRYTFSNPKQLSRADFNYNPGGHIVSYMIINEEVPAATYRRNPSSVSVPEDLMNEIYFLNMQKTSPDVSDLRPFAIGPKGAEIQSAFSIESRWSPLFVTIRYPNTSNTAPYNQSLLIAVNNFQEYFDAPVSCAWSASAPGTTSLPETGLPAADDNFKVWPNPARRSLFFDKEQREIQLYDVNGRMVKEQQYTRELDIFDLAPGIYFIRNADGQCRKVIIQ